MRELTCIICPIGCSLSVEEGSVPVEERSVPASALTVTGNRCKRGAVYAQEEVLAPKRMVTATCGIAMPGAADGADGVCPSRGLTAPRRLPVKTSIPCPKEKIDELLGDIYRLSVSLPVKAGSKLIENWQGSGVDVVAVRSLG